VADRIGSAFAAAKEEDRAVFVPYITAGDRGLETTGESLRALEAAGAGVVELGVPFSDPIADGKTNQLAAERALKEGTTLSGILDLVKKEREGGLKVPVVLFSYYNPILRAGKEFATNAVAAGVDGVLVVDLPPEEAGEHKSACKDAGLSTIFLASPTTTDERLGPIGEASTGFIYYVSRLGVTGTQKSLSKTLEGDLKRLKGKVDRPVAVGFGISTPEQAREVAQLAEGVVVGSALVKLFEDGKDGAPMRLRQAAGALAAAMKRGKTC